MARFFPDRNSGILLGRWKPNIYDGHVEDDHELCNGNFCQAEPAAIVHTVPAVPGVVLSVGHGESFKEQAHRAATERVHCAFPSRAMCGRSH